MYLWQYWRDTRRPIYIYLGSLFLFVLIWAIGMTSMPTAYTVNGSAENLWEIAVVMTFTVTLLCALIMTFVLGNNNVGSEIQKGTGDFLLTRPQPRHYFVWAGWAAGMVEIVALMAISAAVALGCMTIAAGPALWRQARWTARLNTQGPITSVTLIAMNLVLLAAVIFGLTYFLTVLFKNAARGVVTSMAIVFGYYAMSEVLRLWAGISLPAFNFAQHAVTVVPWYLAPRVEIPFWTILAIAFPFGAQVALNRSDI
ncbi:MAG: hypothetical protein ACRD3N_04055 [Terracidiphilus sp.]